MTAQTIVILHEFALAVFTTRPLYQLSILHQHCIEYSQVNYLLEEARANEFCLLSLIKSIVLARVRGD